MLYFGKKGTDLPTHGGSHRNNGLSGIPVVNMAVLGSLVSMAASIVLIIFGIWHCRNYGYSFRLDCTKADCVWSRYTPLLTPVSTSISFPKKDLLDAEYARIDQDGVKVEADRLKSASESAMFGHSIAFNIRLPADSSSSGSKAEKEMIFSLYDMGRRPARTGTTRISKYINYRSPEDEAAAAEDVDEVESDSRSSSSKSRRRRMSSSSKRRASRRDETLKLYSGRMVTALGIISSFCGLLALILCCLFGQWAEAPRVRGGSRHAKKAS